MPRGSSFLVWATPWLVTTAAAQAQTQFVERALSIALHPQLFGTLATGDIDGDGDVDIVVSEFNRGLTVLRNDGAGRFTPDQVGLVSRDAISPVLADIDGDGDLDLVVGVSNGTTYGLGVWENDNRGNYRDVSATALPITGLQFDQVWVVDMNGDGFLDIVCDSPFIILRNRGNRTFATTSSQLLLDDITVGIADMNGDGLPDVLAGNQTEFARRYYNLGNMQFSRNPAPGVPRPVGNFALAAVGDVDRDRDSDLVVLSVSPRLWLNDGRGGLTESLGAYPPTIAYPAGALFGDVDEDGDLDLFVGNGWGFPQQDQLLLNDGHGRFSNAPASRFVSRALGTVAIGMADVDGDGDLDLIAGYWSYSGPNPNATIFYNGLRDLAFGNAPRIGQVATLNVAARRGFATAPQAAVLALSTRPIIAPVRLAPFGDWRLDPQGLIFLPAVVIPAPGGETAINVPVPPQPGLVGQVVSAQALIAHDADPASWRFTGVCSARINP